MVYLREVYTFLLFSYVSGTMSTKFVTKVEMRMKKIPGVERIKRVSGGAGLGSTRGVKDKCEDTLLLDEDSVKAMNVDVWTGLSL